jgi:hypothetical protein
MKVRCLSGVVYFILASFIPAVHATPIKYVLDDGIYPTAPGGWFVYDRATSILSDYSITFAHLSYPTSTFDYPATTIVSSSPNEFKFTDESTAYGLGQHFNVYLGFLSPVTVSFFSSVIDGKYVGDIMAPITYAGESIGANMHLYGRFFSDGPVTAPSPVPEPETNILMLAGLTALYLATRREKKAQQSA